MTRTIPTLTIAMLLALLAVPGLAQQKAAGANGRFAPIDRARLQRVMAADTGVEEFRQEYAAYLGEMEQVLGRLLETSFARQTLARSGMNPQERLAAAKLQLQQLNEQELAGLKNAFAQSSSWRELPRQVDAMLKPEVLTALRNLSAATGGDVLPGGTTPDVCSNAFQDGTGHQTPRVSNSDISIANAAVLAAGAIVDSLPDDFLSVAGKVVAVVARTVVEAVQLTLETLKSISDDCGGNDFQSAVTTSFTGVNDNIATRASQTSVNTLQATANTISTNVTSIQATVGQTQTAVNEINGKVDVKVSTRATMAQVNTLQGTANTINTKADLTLSKLDTVLGRLDDLEALIRAFQAENLRLQIELNLLQGPRYNLAQFQMPQSAGGRLELVRTIVDDTIKKGAQIGVPQSVINQANGELATGDGDFTAKNFKDAYAHFRTAYLLVATNPAMRQP